VFSNYLELTGIHPDFVLISLHTQPYFQFLAQNRQRVKDANPSASFAELNKLLGAEWQGMSDEEKAVCTHFCRLFHFSLPVLMVLSFWITALCRSDRKGQGSLRNPDEKVQA
jgi:hypothetical protein